MTDLLRAREFARAKHGEQKYGSSPYIYHLAMVEETLRKNGVKDQDLLIAAWLHDVLEDTKTTKEELVKEFGLSIATLVAAVTDEPGANRRERHKKAYLKIIITPKAGILKLGDRVSNVQHALRLSCVKEDVEADANVSKQHSLFKMYKKEYDEFVNEVIAKSLDRHNICFILLAQKLKQMMETEKP